MKNSLLTKLAAAAIVLAAAITNPTSVQGGSLGTGLGTGKVSLQDFHFVIENGPRELTRDSETGEITETLNLN
jgi:hypothetical protein